ncbi:MAG: LysR family transcriptional regulator [Proteobacteria bacterium]|nr:LysR family transcriptional regulator [Pseudomonadota bacterium]
MTKTNLHEHLEKLWAFKAIVETGSIRKAAERMHITQPSLTRSIQILEGTLNQQLLVRSKSGVVPTDSGKLLLDLTNSLKDEIERFQLKLQDPKSKWIGKLKVGTYEYLIKHLWSDILLQAKHMYPHLQLQLTAQSSFIPHSHSSTEFDLIVDVEPILSKGLSSIKPKEKISLDEKLAGTDLIYVPSAIDGDRQSLLESLIRFNLNPAKIYEVDTFESCRHLAISGIGATILPASIGDKEVKAKSLKKIQLAGVPPQGFGKHRVCATFLKTKSEDPKILAIIKLLQMVKH